MHLQMIGVAVGAVAVVAHHRRDRLAGQQRNQALDHALNPGVAERSRVGVGGRARHAGIGIAEPLDPGHAETLAGQFGLRRAALAQCLTAQVGGGLTGVTVGAVDHDGPQPQGVRLGQRGRGEDGLVVGMGVQEQQRRSVRRGAAHTTTVATPAPATLPRPRRGQASFSYCRMARRAMTMRCTSVGPS